MIKYSTKRFPVFVRNRLSQIEEASDPNQWRFIDGVRNPADDASRGRAAHELDSRWLQGPPFLQQSESEWPKPPCTFPGLPGEFKVLKRTSVAMTKKLLLYHQC